MIKAIFLDIGGVLVLNGQKQVMEKWADRLGVSLGQLYEGLRNYSHKEMGAKDSLDKSFLTEEQLKEVQKDVWNSEYLNEELLDYLLEHKDTYKYGIITNNYKDADELLMRKFGIEKFYDVFVSSADVGILKPDPRIYEYALNQMGLRANETMLVDDQAVNVEAANGLGMKGIVFVSNESLFEVIVSS